MGCVCHLHIEVNYDGEWIYYNRQRLNRDYELFGKMAGVRDKTVDTIVQPRGLPDDITKQTSIAYQRWHLDAHDESYFSFHHICKLYEWMKEHRNTSEGLRNNTDFHGQFGFLYGNGFKNLHQYPREYPDKLEDVRFIFWFDN